MLSGENLSVYTYFLKPGTVPLESSRFFITAGFGTTTFVPQRIRHSIVHLFVEFDFFPKASGCRGSGGAPYLFELDILFSLCFVSTSSVPSSCLCQQARSPRLQYFFLFSQARERVSVCSPEHIFRYKSCEGKFLIYI